MFYFPSEFFTEMSWAEVSWATIVPWLDSAGKSKLQLNDSAKTNGTVYCKEQFHSRYVSIYNLRIIS